MLLFVFPLASYLLKVLHTRSDNETSYMRLLLIGQAYAWHLLEPWPSIWHNTAKR